MLSASGFFICMGVIMSIAGSVKQVVKMLSKRKKSQGTMLGTVILEVKAAD